MEYSELPGFLKSRRSVREFRDGPLTDSEIASILEASAAAPSAGNLEAWDVVVVTDDEVRYALYDASFQQPHIREAPAVFVICANYVRSMSRYGERGILYAVQDATIAGTYMMLAAHALGLQSCWTGAFDEEAVCETLAVPAHIRPVCLLAVGHGGYIPAAPPRMPMEEHVHRDTW